MTTMTPETSNPITAARRARRPKRHHPQVVHPTLGVEVDEGAVEILDAIIAAGGVPYFSCSGNVGVHGDCNRMSDGHCDCWGYAMFSLRDDVDATFVEFYDTIQTALEEVGVEFSIFERTHAVKPYNGEIEVERCVRLGWFPEDESKVADLITALLEVGNLLV